MERGRGIEVGWSAHGRRGTIHRGATPTPFSTTPGQGGMNSRAHNPTRYVFRASRPSVSPFPPHIFFLSLPSSTSAVDSSLHTAPLTSPPVLITPANFYTPPSLHSICISPASAAPAASF